MQEEYIEKIDNKYVIRRTFNNITYEFAVCDSIEEAIKKRDKIDQDGWPIKSSMIPQNKNIQNENSNNNYFEFDIKIGKAYKHGFLVLMRKETYELLPKLSYEDDCEIELDNIQSKARLNFVPRIVIDRKNEKLIKYLKSLSEIDPKQRRIVKLIKINEVNNPISKEDTSTNELIQENNKLKMNNQKLINENKILKQKLFKLNKKIHDLYEISLE